MTRSRRMRLLAIAVAILPLLASAASRAQGTTVEAPAREAAIHFDRAVKLYDEQDWRAALIEFERAYAISPHFRVLYDIAQCRYQLRDYVGALGAFQKYLAEGGTDLPPSRRAQVESSIDDLRARVAQVHLSADVDGAEVSVDDTPVGTTPLSSPLLVSAGRRKIAVSKAGRVTAVRFIDVAGEDSTDVTFHLAPAASTESKSPAVRSGPGRPFGPAVVSFSVAAVGAGVGTVFGVLAMGNKSDLDRVCAAKACPASSQPLIDESERNALYSSIGYAVGVVALVTGTAYVLLASSGSANGPSAARGVRPVVGLGSAGVVGAF